MLHQEKFKHYFFHSLFWVLIILLNTAPNWHQYTSLKEVIETAGTFTALQIAVAYLTLYALIPSFLEKGKKYKFTIALFGLLLLASEINIGISYFYLEPSYPDSYGKRYESIQHLNYIQRAGFSYVIRYILFSKIPQLLFPAAILVALNFYRRQELLLQFKEQKRSAELNALKNQLNPHFIFNTLNNIYSLALIQSPQTPEAIAKLSEIFDYVLHRCNKDYVNINDEVDMIKAYIGLEKLRFGDRIAINFQHEINQATLIAPLLLLTFIENAFKHGASHELKQAIIDLHLIVDQESIRFVAKNTKPNHHLTNMRQTQYNESIGLKNLKQQLDLLYPEQYQLTCTDNTDSYQVQLTLKRKNHEFD